MNRKTHSESEKRQPVSKADPNIFTQLQKDILHQAKESPLVHK